MNLFIIQSYNADTKESFGPYIEAEAKKLGINVIIPNFPIKTEAKYDKWSAIMNKYLTNKQLNVDSIIIAHSLGTHFVPKYLARNNIEIGLYISCAGFINDHSGREELKKVVDDFSPNDDEIKRAIRLMSKRYAIYSNNDHMNPQNELEYYAEKYEAKRVFLPNIGHMGRSSNIKELPQAIEIIKEYIKK